MKKMITAVLCIGIMLSLYVPVKAFDIFYQRLASPVITGCSFVNTDKPYIDVTFTSSIADAETVRKATYDAILEFVGSEEKLLASEYGYLSYATKNYCQVSIDGQSWNTVAETCEKQATLRLSYYDDIIKKLILAGIDLSACTENAVFNIRMITASENFGNKDVKNVFAYAEASPTTVKGPEFSYIHFILPDDAVFSMERVIVSGKPSEKDIELYPSEGEDKNRYIPSRNGYDFYGWSIEGDKRTSIIPKGVSAVTLTSHWTAAEYEINYVLTTRFGYPFGRADNKNNPTAYFTDTAVSIYDISSPVVGFTFGGWYLTEDFTGEKITQIIEGTTGDIVLYAKWISLEDIAAELKAKQEEYIREKHFGDIDGDGRVTAADARLVLRASVMLENIEPEILRRADYNNSGKISANNARTTLRISVGLDNLYDILLENGMLDSIK